MSAAQEKATISERIAKTMVGEETNNCVYALINILVALILRYSESPDDAVRWCDEVISELRETFNDVRLTLVDLADIETPTTSVN